MVLSDKNLSRLLQKHQLYEDQAEDPAQRPSSACARTSTSTSSPCRSSTRRSGREREVVTAFTVSYDNRDPQRAQQGAAWLINAFLEANRQDRRSYAARHCEVLRHRGRAHAQARRRAGRQAGGVQGEERRPAAGAERDEHERRWIAPRTRSQTSRSQLQATAARARVPGRAAAAGALDGPGNEQPCRRSRTSTSASARATIESHPDLIALRRQIDMMRSGGSTAGHDAAAAAAAAALHSGGSAPALQRGSSGREAHPAQHRVAGGAHRSRANPPIAALASDSPMAVQLQTQLNATDTQIARAAGARRSSCARR